MVDVQIRTRRPGAVGAMMDEYERAVAELSALVSGLSDAEFEAVRDLETADETCRSIQTIMRHVIGASYGYATYIRTALGTPTERPQVALASRADCARMLSGAMTFNVASPEGKSRMAHQASVKLRGRPPRSRCRYAGPLQ